MLTAALLFGALCLAGVALGAGQTDTSFGTNGLAVAPLPEKAAVAEAGIWDLANAPEGKMAAALAGEANQGYFGAARLNVDGSLDRSFGEEGFTADYEVPYLGESNPAPPFNFTYKTQAQGVAVQADGKIVVAGYLEIEAFNHDLSYALVLARYQTNGSLDPSFGEGGVVAPRADNEVGEDVLHAVAITPNGLIIAVGSHGEYRYENFGQPLVLAYTHTGQIDRSFGSGGGVLIPQPQVAGSHPASTLTTVKVLRSGKVLVAGYLFGRLLVARLTAKGKLDKSFGGGDGRVLLKVGEPFSCCGGRASLALAPGGKIILAAEVRGRRSHHLALARLLPNGSLDKSFGRHGLVAAQPTYRLPFPRDVAVAGDGRILVVGYGPGPPKGLSSGLTFRALRYLPNGKLDQSFGQGGLQMLDPGAENSAKAALTQPDGRVVAAGSALQVDREDFETELLLTRYLAGAGG